MLPLASPLHLLPPSLLPCHLQQHRPKPPTSPRLLITVLLACCSSRTACRQGCTAVDVRFQIGGCLLLWLASGCLAVQTIAAAATAAARIRDMQLNHVPPRVVVHNICYKRNYKRNRNHSLAKQPPNGPFSTQQPHCDMSLPMIQDPMRALFVTELYGFTYLALGNHSGQDALH